MERKVLWKGLEKYEIEGPLGKGATAELYLAREKETGKYYAVKRSANLSLLAKEAELLQGMRLSAFPEFREYVQGDCGYLVMEYIRGRDLQELLEEFGAFEIGEAVWIIKEVLKVLMHLHKQVPPLVYRDLKPANIMIEESGGVRLVDLGGCFCMGDGEAEETMVHAGTYGYAAPEQFWSGIVPTPACDVHAAGKLLGYLLTGKNPAQPPYHVEQYYQRSRKIPTAYKKIIRRCMSESAQARYEDAEELLHEIEKAQEECGKERRFVLRKNSDVIYKKCIWLSEYRRIF